MRTLFPSGPPGDDLPGGVPWDGRDLVALDL